MIIPTVGGHIRKFKIGDIIVLLEDVQRSYYMLTRGHELTIVGKNDYGFIFKDEETGIIIKNAQVMKYTHKHTLEESKRINKNFKDKNKFIKFIKDHCSKKDVGYWDRDQYQSCKLKNNRSFANDECKCIFDCFKYVSEYKYKNNFFILNYNRKIKLNKLKKLSVDNEQE